jgi:hypothetical protein
LKFQHGGFFRMHFLQTGTARRAFLWLRK